MYRGIHLAVSVMALGTALMVSPPLSFAAEAARVAVAVVSVERVMNEAKPVAELDREFRATLASQQKQLDHLFAGRLLDDKERSEIETLQKLPSPSEAQRNRMAALAKISDDRQMELERLSRLEKPSDAERARRTQLANWLDRQNQRVVQLQESLGQTRQQKQQDVYKRAMSTVLGVIRTLATERGIELVVDRNSVLFSSADRDITDEVLQRLNGGAASKPAPAKK